MRRLPLRRGLSLLLVVTAAAAWSQTASPDPQVARADTQSSAGESSQTQSQLVLAALPQAPAPQQSVKGAVNGTVLDPAGAIVVGAVVMLTPEGPATPDAPALSTITATGGHFHFGDVPAGSYQLMASWPGFATPRVPVTLTPGQNVEVPPVMMVVATMKSDVQVTLSTHEIAEVEIKEQEKQRILGFLPNFYISYAPHPVPLSTKQKFELAWKTNFDPVTFAVTGLVAGIEQARDDFEEYGQGAQGYGKRYGANYADGFTSTMIGGAILPSLLKQDPRYFYKGTGTVRKRALYAIANAVICKGDNGRWQFNYSALGGAIASGGISNLYYPKADRGAGLVFENAAIGIGATAITNLLQEFVVRKLTPRVPDYNSPAP